MIETRQTVLIIDDNDAVRTALEVLLSLHGLRAVGAVSPEAGLARLALGDVDVVVQDMNFSRDTTSGGEGIALFHQIRANHPGVPIVLLTAWSHLETAVELVKAGAADYVSKPWDDARLLTSLRNLLQLKRVSGEFEALERERRAAREALAANFNLCGAVYESDQMHALVQMATQVARSDVPVLITGPNGAGKEVIAEILQANSAIRGGPFVKVNIGALPDELIEAELFGTETGAFTGARARPGRFEAADGGTLLLDELGNLSAGGQAKLLRVLQTGEFERLGSNQTRRVRVRLVAATNTNLRQAIREGRFREDLYFRLNVIELELPPLAERREDIPLLAGHFLAALSAKYRKKLNGFAAEATEALLRAGWPGNVRQLFNVVEKCVALATTPLIPLALVERALNRPAEDMASFDEARRAFERDYLVQLLKLTRGNVSQAARVAKRNRSDFYTLLNRHEIEPGSFKA